MNFSELLRYRVSLINVFEEYGVASPRVFGSTVSGSATTESDVDFLVSWPVQHSLIDRIRLKNRLESILSTHVDLLTDQTIHPLIRESVTREARPI